MLHMPLYHLRVPCVELYLYYITMYVICQPQKAKKNSFYITFSLTVLMRYGII
nr:MAG TPA: hypothetical protein [Caudoviricetes sp.]